MSTDEAYLNLLLWQTLGSTSNHLIWCCTLGLLFQSIMLGVLLSQTRRYVEAYAISDPAIMVLGVVTGLGIIITILAMACLQTHRLLSRADDYASIFRADNVDNMVLLGFAGVMGVAGTLCGIWKVWKMAGSKRCSVCGPLLVGALASLGVMGATVAHGAVSPEITVANLTSLSDWANKLAKFCQVWSGLMVGMNGVIWLSTVILLMKQRSQFGPQDGLGRLLLWIVTESILPVLVVSLVFLAQLGSNTPSLATSSRITLQALPSISLYSILNPLTYRGRLQAIIDYRSEGGIKLSTSGYSNGMGRDKRMTGSSLGLKAFSYRERPRDEERHSVRVTVDTYVAESISPPPSAYSFHNRRADASPLASPTPTLFAGNSSSASLSQITAPFGAWDVTEQVQADGQSFRTAVAPSFKSAVPSGKSVMGAKSIVSKSGRSQRSKSSSRKMKNQAKAGPVLDPTGWPDMPKRVHEEK